MTMLVEQIATRRVATYERVSSEDQADRGTIRTQTDGLDARLAATPHIRVVGRFSDDGVSGTIPLSERPDGGRLMALAAAGEIDEVWVYKLDRLGRDAIDLLGMRRRFDTLGVRLLSLVEGEQHALAYDLQAVIADYARVEFLRRSADGMDRAAREGRYIGGIVPYGYRVDGEKGKARLVPDTSMVWGAWTAVDVVRRMYEAVALEDRSCRQVADELNALGIPTSYARAGRGIRGKRTQEIWGAGRIRGMVVESIYRGEQVFGKRSKRPRATISAPLEPIVSVELWQSAQDALARHRIMPKNSARTYLLRGIMDCSLCERKFVGSRNKGGGWYRCGGHTRGLGPGLGRCRSRSIKDEHIEPIVWQDIERFLRHPGELLDELDAHRERDRDSARRVADLEAVDAKLVELDVQRLTAQRLAVRGSLTDDELDTELARVEADRAALERHRASIEPPAAEAEAPDADLLKQLRLRLDAGLSDQERHEIVRLLVGKISITTTINEDSTKDVSAMISYRFPGVLATRTGTGSWPRSTGDWPDSEPNHGHERPRPNRPPRVASRHQGRPGRTLPVHQGTACRCVPGSPAQAAVGVHRRPWPRTTWCGVERGTDVHERRGCVPRYPTRS